MNLQPPAVPSGPFTLATGRALGLTEKQMRASGLHVPTSGVRMIAPPDGLVEHARAVSLVLPPGAAFSHVTAARLHGWPLSYAVEEDTRLHVTDRIDRPHLRREGLVGHRALHPRTIVTLDGLPVVAAADTWVDLGELVGRGKPVGLDDLIVAGDVAATSLGSVVSLRAVIDGRVRPRGKVTLLEALPWIRLGSASPRETIVRLMLARAGLPEPRLNHPIFASWDPAVILGVGDLVWIWVTPEGRVVKVVGEYQGAAYHSSEEQRRSDGQRRARLEADGWIVVEIWNEHVNTTQARHDTIRRFAAALCFSSELLDLDAAEPRFFSRHAMELALQRADRRRQAVGARHR